MREPRRPAPAAAVPGEAAAVGAQPFRAFTPAAPTRGGAAARHLGAAGIVMLVIVATAVALIVYFVAR